MRYFIDTEFIEDGRTIDLVSIGVVAEDGREFYRCSTEADLTKANEWVRKNVLASLPGYADHAWCERRHIARELSLFLDGDPKPEFWAYYGDYDWVALCQLYGTMMQLPAHFPKWCRDLKQLSVDVGSPKHPPDPVGEHNALIDARWNRDLYAFLVSQRRGATP